MGLPQQSGDDPLQKELSSLEARIKELENALTLDTILTVLDGVNEHRGRVIIATTNHLDKIDPALMRAGRFDLKINLGKFNCEEIREMLSIMFGPSEMIQKAEFPDGKFESRTVQRKFGDASECCRLFVEFCHSPMYRR
jgi:SpoVK/Ycf46/Vps4 family AAA+-type ATPase